MQSYVPVVPFDVREASEFRNEYGNLPVQLYHLYMR